MSIMVIIKKSGKTEYFDINKVKTSIANSALDIGFPLTEADLNMLVQDTENKLYKLREASLITSSYEVRGIAYHVLIDCGFSSVAKSYMEMEI
jgi:transcriptional repressor NrdR